jgi:hypothetical protein
MAANEDSGTTRPSEPDPNESPFELPGVAGIPYGKKSAEARAIREALEEFARERAARSAERSD